MKYHPDLKVCITHKDGQSTINSSIILRIYPLPDIRKVPSIAVVKFAIIPIATKHNSDSVGSSVNIDIGIKTVTISVSVLLLLFLVSFRMLQL